MSLKRENYKLFAILSIFSPSNTVRASLLVIETTI